MWCMCCWSKGGVEIWRYRVWSKDALMGHRESEMEVHMCSEIEKERGKREQERYQRTSMIKMHQIHEYQRRVWRCSLSFAMTGKRKARQVINRAPSSPIKSWKKGTCIGRQFGYHESSGRLQDMTLKEPTKIATPMVAPSRRLRMPNRRKKAPFLSSTFRGTSICPCRFPQP